MALSDPDLLAIVRKMRQNMSALDNIHTLTISLSKISDKNVVDSTYVLLPKLSNIAQDIAEVLKLIEATKQYRDMIKNYGLEDSND